MITTIILFAVFGPSSGAPLTTSTYGPLRRESSNNTDSPDLRTTQDIVWSCIATIFACTWVAIHPNLPEPRISGWSRFKQRTEIMILAVFAPEFILIWALRQRIAAESVMKEYNHTILGIDKGQKSLILRAREWFHVPPPPYNGPVWTLTHGFYVQMGGFLLYNKDTAVRVLHFRELIQLVQLGAVDRPDVTEEDICDLSKGDLLAKALVVVQTTWFIFQCLARWAAKLPVTELEIMTLAFAALNIITYCLWWEKPQNVCVGVRVQVKEGAVVRLRALARLPVTNWHSVFGMRRTAIESVMRKQQSGTTIAPNEEEMDIADSLRGLHPLEIRDLLSDLENHPETPIPANPPPHKSSANDMPLWSRAVVTTGRLLCSFSRGVLKSALYRRLREVLLGPTPQIPGTSAPRPPIATILKPDTLKIGTFYAYDTLDQKFGLVLFAVTSGALFGGLHLIPWKFTFPTHVGPQILKLHPTVLRWALLPLRAIVIAIPFYVLARILIIVLAFVTLRSLPPGADQDISWNSFVPHI